MAEEVENSNDGTLSGLKKTIIGVITTAVMGLGTWGITQITGGDKEEAAPVQQAAPIINITNSNQQSQYLYLLLEDVTKKEISKTTIIIK